MFPRAIGGERLGAAGPGDLGRHFPKADPRWKGADSRTLLRHVHSRLVARGWRVGNVDATIIAQAPRMAPHVASMVANIAADLTVDLDADPGAVNVKATTTERLGFTGRGEGIAAQAVASIVRG